ncbi:MAG: hypothetical protein ACP5HU_07450 [Phycisphaerae bacterium]
MPRFIAFCHLVLLTAAFGCHQAGPAAAGPKMDHLRIDTDRRSWSGEDFSGSEFITDHYRVYSTASGRAVEQHLPGFMEASYENYLELTGLPDRPQAGQRMPIYVMGTREQWAMLTRSVVPPQQVNTYLSIQAGGYCYEDVCVFWDLGPLNTFPVAAHEGMHQFVAHRLEHPLPLWLEEGLCTLAEGHEIEGDAVRFDPRENHERFQALRTGIVNGDWIPLEDLLGMHAGDAVGKAPGKAGAYYSQLWALALFIRSEPTYNAGLQRLLQDAEAGEMHATVGMDERQFSQLAQMRGVYNRRMSEPLFRQYIAADMEGFERQYYAFAKKLADLQ